MWLVTLQPADKIGHGLSGEEEAASVAISSASVLSLVTRFGRLAARGWLHVDSYCSFVLFDVCTEDRFRGREQNQSGL